jgi:hypothetical protein
VSIAALNVALPIGISFYTFQCIGYVLDVYRGTVSDERHLGMLALFAAFWPLLVSGPIERAGRMLPQFRQRIADDGARRRGLRLILWGVFKKVVSPTAWRSTSTLSTIGPASMAAALCWRHSSWPSSLRRLLRLQRHRHRLRACHGVQRHVELSPTVLFGVGAGILAALAHILTSWIRGSLHPARASFCGKPAGSTRV